MDRLIDGVRVSVRSLRKRSGFSLVVVLTLALGIGASTAVFSLVNGVLLRPLPYPHPDRVVIVWEKPPGYDYFAVAPANFLDWKQQNQVFQDMAAIASATVNLTGSGEPERIWGHRVSASFFPILGVQPALGRSFSPEEDQPDAERVVVLSHSLWSRRFNSDSSLVGRTISLDRVQYTVIGVMPEGFQDFTDVSSSGTALLWLPYPFASDPPTERQAKRLRVVARLRPDVSLERAQQDMEQISGRLVAAYPEAFYKPPGSTETWSATVRSLSSELTGNVRGSLLVLLGAVGFVLLIACVNVANLFLVRTGERSRELAVRKALGAGPIGASGHLLTESLILALLGCAGGIVLARWLIGFVTVLNPTDLPRLDQVGIDGRVLGFALLLALFTALAVSLAPTLHAARLTLTESLKEGEERTGAGRRGRAGREILVISEIALSVILLTGAGLMLNAIVRMQHIDLGFDSENLLLTRVYLPRTRYAEATGFGTTSATQRFTLWTIRPEQSRFVEEVVGRMAARPEVLSAAAVAYPPGGQGGWGLLFTIEGRPPPEPGENPTNAYVKAITPGYMGTMGIPILQGRDFTGLDRAGAPEVALVNQRTAREYWGEESPIGARFRMKDGIEDEERSFEIVGVVGNAMQVLLDDGPERVVYIPYTQQAQKYADWQVGFRMGVYFVARTRAGSDGLGAAMRRAVWDVDPEQPIRTMQTMDQMIGALLSTRRFYAQLLASFAVVGLLLASMGIYGVMSYSVARQRHEIGVRLALGAEPAQILRKVMTRGLGLIVVGVVVGLAGSIGLTRLLESQLYGVSSTDPATFAVGSLLLVLVALAACYAPARKAAKVDPLVALRTE